MEQQNINLQDIANAIREKEGSTESISANSFADRISNLQAINPIELYTVTTNTEPEGLNSVTTNIIGSAGIKTNIYAEVEKDGFEFKQWNENGELLSTNNPYSIIISSNRIITGVYEEKPSFEWGEDGESVDAEWFTGLKEYLLTNSGASLGNILGKTKSVTLNTSVLGTTTHLIRVIGVDQDADNTITFQTANCLNEATTWSTLAQNSSNTTAARWDNAYCKAHAMCEAYYNAFPGKEAIKTVIKGTCANTDNNRNSTPTYRNETVFLPSMGEMGLNTNSPLSLENSSINKAECTQGKNFSYAYYTDNVMRIKKLGDNGDDCHYWGRSRFYLSDYSTYACRVHNNGMGSGNAYWNTNGLSPAFVIGN